MSSAVTNNVMWVNLWDCNPPHFNKWYIYNVDVEREFIAWTLVSCKFLFILSPMEQKGIL